MIPLPVTTTTRSPWVKQPVRVPHSLMNADKPSFVRLDKPSTGVTPQNKVIRRRVLGASLTAIVGTKSRCVDFARAERPESVAKTTSLACKRLAIDSSA